MLRQDRNLKAARPQLQGPVSERKVKRTGGVELTAAEQLAWPVGALGSILRTANKSLPKHQRVRKGVAIYEALEYSVLPGGG